MLDRRLAKMEKPRVDDSLVWFRSNCVRSNTFLAGDPPGVLSPLPDSPPSQSLQPSVEGPADEDDDDVLRDVINDPDPLQEDPEAQQQLECQQQQQQQQQQLSQPEQIESGEKSIFVARFLLTTSS